MEQQPGPVNWAPWNPDPLPGMARLWAWEAFAHGAEAVCYFRWRQAPFAQEQMHAGLLRPDSVARPGAMTRRRRWRANWPRCPRQATGAGRVALVFDYASRLGLGYPAAGPRFQLFPAGVRVLQGPAPAWADGRHPAARRGGPVGLQAGACSGHVSLSRPAAGRAGRHSRGRRCWGRGPIPRRRNSQCRCRCRRTCRGWRPPWRGSKACRPMCRCRWRRAARCVHWREKLEGSARGGGGRPGRLARAGARRAAALSGRLAG